MFRILIPWSILNVFQVFHLALMVFAALQVHETKTALVVLTANECASLQWWDYYTVSLMPQIFILGVQLTRASAM